ncbi:MAG: carboxypeptidase-like regulatory domain-containing protein [Bacteroidales bacterium]
MKTNFITYLLISVFGLGLLFTSCKKDEPQAEQVEHPHDQQKYYIIGHVTTAAALSDAGVSTATPIEGVNVKADGLDPVKTNADGSYSLISNKKGITITVTFSKDGYLTSKGNVTLSSDMKGLESVTLNAMLTKANPTVTVNPNTQTTVAHPQDRSGLTIPAGTLSAAKEVSITTGNIEANNRVPGISIYMEPMGLQLNKPAELTVKNVFKSSNLSFVNPKLQIESSLSKSNYFTKAQSPYDWTDLNVMNYNPSTNTYFSDINQLGLYKVVPTIKSITTVQATTDETNTYLEIDNSDNIAALKNVEISINVKTGWDFTTDIVSSIKNQIPDILDEDAQQLANIIQSIAQQYSGTPRGVKTLEITESINVSGQTVMIYQNIPTIMQSTIVIPVNYDKNAAAETFSIFETNHTTYNISATANFYTGAKASFKEISGGTHSGGAGQ